MEGGQFDGINNKKSIENKTYKLINIQVYILLKDMRVIARKVKITSRLTYTQLKIRLITCLSTLSKDPVKKIIKE